MAVMAMSKAARDVEDEVLVIQTQALGYHQ